MANIQVNRRI